MSKIQSVSESRTENIMKNTAKTSVPVESRVTGVTVYLSGAQITRTGSLPGKAGTHNLVFEKLGLGKN